MPDIYLAAPYSARAETRAHMQQLLAQGWTASATWAFGMHEAIPPSICARHDLEEIAACRCVVADLTNGRSTQGGMHFELGFAQGRGIPIILVGDPEGSVFLHTPGIRLAPHWKSNELEKHLRAVCRGEYHDA